MSNGITIDPTSRTVVVTITAQTTGALLTLFDDANLQIPFANPFTLTPNSSNTVFTAVPALAFVSMKVSGVELATATGNPVPFQFSDGLIGSAQLAPLANGGLVGTTPGTVAAGDDPRIVGAELGNASIIYVGPNGLDANTGLAVSKPKLTLAGAIAALPAGQCVIKIMPGNISSGNVAINLPNGVDLIGSGRGSSSITWSTDLGSGVFGLTCLGANYARNRILDVELIGPGNGIFTVGTSPCLMDGVKSSNQMLIVNSFIHGWHSGVTFLSDHEAIFQSKISANFYNLYYGASSIHGNQSLIAIDLTGATRSSIGMHASNGIDSVYWADVHCGFAPFAFYKEDGTGFALITNSVIDGLSLEQIGNAVIFDATVSGTQTMLADSTLQINGNAISYSATTYYDSAFSRAYAVDVLAVTNNFVVKNDRLSLNPNGGVGIYRMRLAGAPSAMTTDRTPAQNDFVGNFNGTRYLRNTASQVDCELYYASQAITTAAVVQLQGAGQVVMFGNDNSFSYIGIAVHAALSGTNVAVARRGHTRVQLNATVQFAGNRMQIDPASPNKVRPIAGSVGTTGDTYFGKHPIIGISGGSGTAGGTVDVYLVDPYIESAYVAPGSVSALPAASSTYRGQHLNLLGNGTTTADINYVCLISATGTYSWKQVVSG